MLEGLRQRYRAQRLGFAFRDPANRRPVYFWCDPETGRLWMATRRWALFRVPLPGDRPPEAIVGMLHQLGEPDVPEGWRP